MKIRRGDLPTELGGLLDELEDFSRRIDTLESPDGNQLAQTVKVLGETVAELQVLVTDLETYLDDYIVTSLPALVDAAVAAALATALAGNITIGGTLTVAGAVHLSNVPGKVFSAEPRTVVWVDTSNGRIGRT